MEFDLTEVEHSGTLNLTKLVAVQVPAETV
jgi:hypothetical protein